MTIENNYVLCGMIDEIIPAFTANIYFQLCGDKTVIGGEYTNACIVSITTESPFLLLHDNGSSAISTGGAVT